MCSVKAGITAVVNKILEMIQKVRKHTKITVNIISYSSCASGIQEPLPLVALIL